MKARHLLSRGQSLLELIVTIGVVAIVITGLVNAITASLRYGQSTRQRSQGVKLAQEGIEVARQRRDTSDWTTFLTMSGSGSESWCLDADRQWSLAPINNECPISEGDSFWRYVTFRWNDPLMEVESEVSWADRSASSTVSFTTYYSQWRQ